MGGEQASSSGPASVVQTADDDGVALIRQQLAELAQVARRAGLTQEARRADRLSTMITRLADDARSRD